MNISVVQGTGAMAPTWRARWRFVLSVRSANGTLDIDVLHFGTCDQRRGNFVEDMPLFIIEFGAHFVSQHPVPFANRNRGGDLVDNVWLEVRTCYGF